MIQHLPNEAERIDLVVVNACREAEKLALEIGSPAARRAQRLHALTLA